MLTKPALFVNGWFAGGSNLVHVVALPAHSSTMCVLIVNTSA